jgi:hypothetical protein
MLTLLLGALGLTGGGIGIAMLLGGGPWMLALARTALGFLGSLNVWQLGCLGLALFAFVQHFEIAAGKRHSAKVEKQLSQCVSARHADRESYARAQADAQAQNKAHVIKVEQQYQRNSDDERQAYLSDLAKLRAGRVRQQNPAPRGDSNSAGPSPAPAPTEGADADGLPLPPATMCKPRK